eukprot:5449141-Lingulodinium_polyedra.AAC.1
MTSCPPRAARCRTISYLTRNALIVSPGHRENASISVMLVRRLSSSRTLKRRCKLPRTYATGSTLA